MSSPIESLNRGNFVSSPIESLNRGSFVSFLIESLTEVILCPLLLSH